MEGNSENLDGSGLNWGEMEVARGEREVEKG